MIVGWCKNLGLTPYQVLYDYSYSNLVLLTAAIPAYDDIEDKEWDSRLDANNPNNFGGDEIEYI